MPAKTPSAKGGRKIDASEAVKRMDSALKREMSTPPKPYQQELERKAASAKARRATVDEALRRIDQATNRKAAQSKEPKPGRTSQGKSGK